MREYEATCAEFPTIRATHDEPYVAVYDLLDDIDVVQRMQEPVVDEQDADSSHDDDRRSYPDGEHDECRWESTWVTDWNILVRDACGEWDYEIKSDNLAEFLHHDSGLREAWAATGIPPVPARKFRALLLEPGDARRLHQANCTPEQALPHVVKAESTGWWNWPDYNVVDWIIVGIPVDRVRTYEAAGCSATEAATWESVIALHGLSTQDLRDVLRAGLTPDSVAAAAAWQEEGHSVGDAARNLISAMCLDRGPLRIVSGRP